MGSVNEKINYLADLKNIKNQYYSQKVESQKQKNAIDNNTKFYNQQTDSVEISESGKNMYNLQTESIKYIEMVNDTKIIDKDMIMEIKEKIVSDYYSKPEAIEIVSKKMLDMPNYIAIQ